MVFNRKKMFLYNKFVGHWFSSICYYCFSFSVWKRLRVWSSSQVAGQTLAWNATITRRTNCCCFSGYPSHCHNASVHCIIVESVLFLVNTFFTCGTCYRYLWLISTSDTRTLSILRLVFDASLFISTTEFTNFCNYYVILLLLTFYGHAFRFLPSMVSLWRI